MKEFSVESKKQIEAIDVTSRVEALLDKKDGVAVVFVPHATCALFVNEFEPNIKSDYEKLFGLLKKEAWKHDEIDDNAAAHLASALVGASVVVPVEGGRLALGQWQRIILIELDGSRKRMVCVSFLPSPQV